MENGNVFLLYDDIRIYVADQRCCAGFIVHGDNNSLVSCFIYGLDVSTWKIVCKECK